MGCVEYLFDSVKNKLIHAPFSVQFEISGKCVAKCVTCKITQQGLEHHPTIEEITKVICDLSKYGTKSIRLTGGEPLLANRFDAIVRECLKNGITPSVTTTLLTKNEEHLKALLKCSRIKVSLPTVNERFKDFFCIDNSNFETVKNNLEFLRKNKKRFSVNYTIFDKNYSLDSIQEFIAFINHYSPFYVTFFPALNFEHTKCEEIVKNFLACSNLTKFKSNIKTIKKHFERRKPRKTVICHITKFHAHIKRNGDVYPCCMTGGEVGQELLKEFKLGNLFNESISEIYARSFSIFDDKNLANNEICKNCTQRYLDLNNKYKDFISDRKSDEI
jgi:radical SAM protein with 4Fe4S-binding SPASM domain